MQGVDELCCCDRMFLLWSVDWGGVAYLCHGPDFTSLYNLVLSDLPACASGFSSVNVIMIDLYHSIFYKDEVSYYI